MPKNTLSQKTKNEISHLAHPSIKETTPEEVINYLKDLEQRLESKPSAKKVVDLLSSVKRITKLTSRLERISREIFFAKFTKEEGRFKGENDTLLVTKKSRKILSKDKIEEKFGKGSIEDCYNEIEVFEVSIIE